MDCWVAAAHEGRSKGERREEQRGAGEGRLATSMRLNEDERTKGREAVAGLLNARSPALFAPLAPATAVLRLLSCDPGSSLSHCIHCLSPQAKKRASCWNNIMIPLSNLPLLPVLAAPLFLFILHVNQCSRAFTWFIASSPPLLLLLLLPQLDCCSRDRDLRSTSSRVWDHNLALSLSRLRLLSHPSLAHTPVARDHRQTMIETTSTAKPVKKHAVNVIYSRSEHVTSAGVPVESGSQG